MAALRITVRIHGPVALSSLALLYSGSLLAVQAVADAQSFQPPSLISVTVLLLFLSVAAIAQSLSYNFVAWLFAVPPVISCTLSLAMTIPGLDLALAPVAKGTRGTGWHDFFSMEPITVFSIVAGCVGVACSGRHGRPIAHRAAHAIAASLLAVSACSLAVAVLEIPAGNGAIDFTKIAPHIAVGIALVALAILATSRRNLSESDRGLLGAAHWMALGAGLVITIALYQLMRTERSEKWRIIVQAETSELREHTQLQWSEQVQAIERHAFRWRALGGVEEAVWRRDAAQYVEDFRGLAAFAYCSRDFETVWIEHAEEIDVAALRAVAQRPASERTMHRAFDAKGTALSPPLSVLPGRNHILAVTPAQPEDESGGLFAALFDIDRLLDDVISETESERFMIEVRHNQDLVFSTHVPAPDVVEYLRHAEPVDLYDLGWTLNVVPTQAYFRAVQSHVAETVLVLGLLVTIAITGSFRERGRALRLAHENARRNDALAAEISEREAVQRSLQQREAHIETLMGSTAEAIYGVDQEGRCTYCNQSCLRLLGYQSEQDLLGKNMHALIHHTRPDGSTYPETECRIFLAFRAGEGVHVDDEYLWRADGTPFPAEYWSFPVRQGGSITGSVVTFLDITERRRTEEALRESEERFQLAVRGATDGIWDWNILTSEVWYSERFKELLGYNPEDTFPHSFETFANALHPDDYEGTLEALQQHVQKNLPYDVEYRLRSKDGTYRWFRARGACTRDEIGQAVRMAGSVQDITDRRELIDELRELNRHLLERTNELAQRSQEVEAFVYIVSHDLRAPLVNIQGFCAELENSGEDLMQLVGESEFPEEIATRLRTIVEEDIPGSLKFIKAGTSKFERLIDALLRLSRTGRQAYTIEQLDMDEVLRGVAASLEKNISDAGAEVDLEPLPPISGDRTAIEQVFSNLIGNALQYLRADEPGRVRIGGDHTPGHRLCHFWVEDNGEGIPDSARERVFQVFQRAHPKKCDGEGMGLAIARRIVERHGGELWLETQVGSGTTFHFTLPSAGSPGPPTNQSQGTET